jgi:hypothetical protein
VYSCSEKKKIRPGFDISDRTIPLSVSHSRRKADTEQIGVAATLYSEGVWTESWPGHALS